MQAPFFVNIEIFLSYRWVSSRLDLLLFLKNVILCVSETKGIFCEYQIIIAQIARKKRPIGAGKLRME